MPRILLLGAKGQLGVELEKVLAPESDLIALSRREVDLADGNAMRMAVRRAQPEIVINAAAYTAVDRAESESAIARTINAIAPGILAEETARAGAALIHFSTDYVFDGSRAGSWTESDKPAPLNIYGKTKLEGERAIEAAGGRYFIFRTSWVYAAHGANFLRTMVRLARERKQLSIVNDQVGAPTSAGELARAVRGAIPQIDTAQPGVYHMTCRGQTSWFGFAQAIFAGLGGVVPAPELIPIATAQYPTPAQRPRNSVLDCAKLERAMGIRLLPWEEALAKVIEELRAGGV
jgi:dTDP-4-dehydrorhamnose reductase